MPNDNPSDPIQGQSMQDGPNRKPLNPPSPPDDPHSETAQGISSREVQAEVKDIEDRVKRAERWMIGLTAAIAFFGLCSVVVGAFQWSAMHGQLREMHQGGIDTHALANAAGDQADAAQQFSDTAEDINGRMSEAVDQLSAAADNAKASIRVTQDAMRLDQRAWMGGETIDGLPEMDKPFIIKLTVKNTGRTPAQHVHLLARYYPTLKGQPFRFDIGNVKDQSSGLLPPGAAASTSVWAAANGGTTPTPLTKADMDAALNGTYVVHVIGKITYDDIFKRHHWVTICAQLSPDAKSWPSCAEYNEADDN